MLAAVLFLGAYALPIIHPDLPSWAVALSRWTSWLTWGMFVVDYIARLVLADKRSEYMLRHWLDLIVIALPLLRPLRLLRLVPLLAVVNRRATTRLRGRVATYVVGGAILLAFCAALAVLDAERSAPHARIHTFGDAIWWSLTTMTTVGYGDMVPVTTAGRAVAAALMIGGIALLGTVTATLAAWFVDEVRGVEQQQTENLEARIARVEAKIDALALTNRHAIDQVVRPSEISDPEPGAVGKINGRPAEAPQMHAPESSPR
jgi:voltage-gated potassium channel